VVAGLAWTGWAARRGPVHVLWIPAFSAQPPSEPSGRFSALCRVRHNWDYAESRIMPSPTTSMLVNSGLRVPGVGIIVGSTTRHRSVVAPSACHGCTGGRSFAGSRRLTSDPFWGNVFLCSACCVELGSAGPGGCQQLRPATSERHPSEPGLCRHHRPEVLVQHCREQSCRHNPGLGIVPAAGSPVTMA